MLALCRMISTADPSVALHIFRLGEMLWRLSQERVRHILRLPMATIWGTCFWFSKDSPLAGHLFFLIPFRSRNESKVQNEKPVQNLRRHFDLVSRLVARSSTLLTRHTNQ